MFRSVRLNSDLPNELEAIASFPIFQLCGNAFIEHVRIAPLPAEVFQWHEFRRFGFRLDVQVGQASIERLFRIHLR